MCTAVSRFKKFYNRKMEDVPVITIPQNLYRDALMEQALYMHKKLFSLENAAELACLNHLTSHVNTAYNRLLAYGISLDQLFSFWLMHPTASLWTGVLYDPANAHHHVASLQNPAMPLYRKEAVVTLILAVMGVEETMLVFSWIRDNVAKIDTGEKLELHLLRPLDILIGECVGDRPPPPEVEFFDWMYSLEMDDSFQDALQRSHGHAWTPVEKQLRHTLPHGTTTNLWEGSYCTDCYSCVVSVSTSHTERKKTKKKTVKKTKTVTKWMVVGLLACPKVLPHEWIEEYKQLVNSDSKMTEAVCNVFLEHFPFLLKQK